MRKGISIEVTPVDRGRLQSIVRDRNSPQKHVWRARIVLLSGDGIGTMAIMRAVGKGKTVVWRWQQRFTEEGVAGLTRDKTRPSRTAPLPAATVDRVIELTNQAPPHQATHWTAPAMAKAVAISPSSVRRIWVGQGLQPHRVRAFKLSNDPNFADKLKAVVGLYIGRGDADWAWRRRGHIGGIPDRGRIDAGAAPAHLWRDLRDGAGRLVYPGAVYFLPARRQPERLSVSGIAGRAGDNRRAGADLFRASGKPALVFARGHLWAAADSVNQIIRRAGDRVPPLAVEALGDSLQTAREQLPPYWAH